MEYNEFFKILMSDKPSDELKSRKQEVFKLVPFLNECDGFDQESEWHPYDVYEHILHVVDNVEKDPILRLAALFHDIGKPSTFVKDEKGGHFPKHWLDSKMIFGGFTKKVNLSSEIADMVSELIYFHDIDLSNPDDDTVERIKNRLSFAGVDYLFKLKEADLKAQNPLLAKPILDDLARQKEALISRLSSKVK